MTRRLPTLALVTLGPILTPAVAVAGADALVPESWGGKLSIGYERRAEDSAEVGDPSSGRGDSRFWFTEPEDFMGTLRLWAEWKLRPFRHSTKIEIAYERQDWRNGEILGRDVYSVELKQGLSKTSRLELDLEFAPQIYITHRVDKDALPGQPRFRPEAYRELEVEAGYRRTWHGNIYTTAFFTYTNRDETEWFNERDRERRGIGLLLDLPLGERSRVKPEYGFRVNSSRNEPDLGKDLSYREHLTELRIQTGLDRVFGPWRLDLRTRWKFRNYTTDNPEDTRRYKRNEQIYFWEVKLMRPLGITTPFFAWERTGRWVDVPGDVGTVDEDGEFDRTLLQLGMEWEL